MARQPTLHHGHEHGNERRVLWALLLTVGFMAAEVVGGLLSGSLALLADAGHMLTDAAALGLAWHAFRDSRRPATPARSYGHARFQVLAALINGAALYVVALWIITEAFDRLRKSHRGAGRPDAAGRLPRACRQHPGLFHPPCRWPRQSQHQRRAASYHRRSARIGGGHSGGMHHPSNRLDADRSDPFGGGRPPDPQGEYRDSQRRE